MGNDTSRTASTLVVKLDKTEVISGGLLTGKVYLDVRVDFFPCTAIELLIEGYEEATVRYTTQSGTSKKRVTNHHTAVESKTFMSLPVTIATITNEGLRKGNYEYPFQVGMPSGMVGTFKGYSFKIDYRAVGKLTSPQTANATPVQHTAPFSVVSGLAQIPALPLYMPPVITPVVTMCCINRGSMAVGALVSSSIAVPGEPFRVSYAVHNLSTVRVKAITVEVTKTVDKSARDFRGNHCTRAVEDIFSERVEVEQLMGLELRPDTAEHSDFTALSADVLKSLKASIDAGKCVLDVKLNKSLTPPSYDGQLVQISYEINLTVHTTFGTSNIVISEPLQVVSRLPGTDAISSLVEHIPGDMVEEEPSLLTAGDAPPAYSEVPHDWAPVRSKMVYIPAAVALDHSDITLSYGAGTYAELLETLSTSMAPVAAAEEWLGQHTQFSVQALSGDELCKLFMSLKQSIDQVNFADLLSSKMTSLKCDTLAQVLRTSHEIVRREVASRLLQRVPVEDKQNKAAVLGALSSFDAMAIEPYFA